MNYKIINPFRNKPLEQREPVHDEQIQLAIRNKCLIIETVTLLKVFENYLMGKYKKKDIEQMFIQRTGLLNLSEEGDLDVC